MVEAEFQSRVITVPRTIPVRDASVIDIMIPKGLAAAMLVAIPLYTGVTEELCTGTTTYAIILVSIVICPVLVILLERTPVRRIYGRIFFQNSEWEAE